MAQNSFRLKFDADAYQHLKFITASVILDVSFFTGNWTDKLVGHIAIKAREELVDLWRNWATQHRDRRFAAPPTVVTVMFDQETCRLFICASVKGVRYDTSFTDSLPTEHSLFIRAILQKSCKEMVAKDGHIGHMFNANCGEVHAVCLWHLSNPRNHYTKLKDAVIATAGLPVDDTGARGTVQDVVIYTPCGSRSPGCKEIVKELGMWAIQRTAFEKCEVEDNAAYRVEPVIQALNEERKYSYISLAGGM